MDDPGARGEGGAATVVILPTYDERGTLEELVEGILRAPGAADVLVVDDNSPDGTGAVADRIAARTARVSVVHRPGKMGLGSAYVAGFRRALERGADRAVTMDADLSHHPRHLAAIVAAAGACDIAIGSRYVAGGGVAEAWGWHRILLSRWANVFTRRALGFEIRDCTSGFRCYRRAVLEGIDWNRIRSNGYSFLVETLYAARDHGFSFGEVPIQFESRSHGRSKIGIGEIFRAIATVARLQRARARR